MTGRPRIVDAHHHVWDLSVRDQDWITGEELAPLRRDFTMADLEPEARANGVDATVLVQTVTVAAETPEFLALADGSDLVAGVVGWSDLTAPDIADTLAALRELPGGDRLVGLRHQVQGEPDPRWLLRPDVLRGLTAVSEAGLVYDLLVQPHQLPAAVRAAELLPGLVLVLDHSGKPPVAAGELHPGPTSCGPSPPCPTPCANSPDSSPRRTRTTGPSRICARTRTPFSKPSGPPG